MRILALDLSGSDCGWAINGDGRVDSGTFCCTPPAGSLPGRRFLILRQHLKDLLRKYENVGLFAYERPHLRGRAATEQCVGAVTTLLAIAAALNVRTVDVHSGTLKKHVTSNGKASKEDMIAWACKWTKRDITSDDEADACAVLAWAIAEHYPKKSKEDEAYDNTNS